MTKFTSILSKIYLKLQVIFTTVVFSPRFFSECTQTIYSLLFTRFLHAIFARVCSFDFTLKLYFSEKGLFWYLNDKKYLILSQTKQEPRRSRAPDVLFCRMFCKENMISDLIHVTVTKMSFKMIWPKKWPQGQMSMSPLE